LAHIQNETKLKLNTLLEGVPVSRITGNEQAEAGEIRFDSRAVKQGDLFIAIKGSRIDGHTFIETAIEKGARIVVCETLPDQPEETVCWVVVPDARHALAVMAANAFGKPANELQLVGITGTNGKTSVATLLYQLFSALGYPSGLISTIEYRIGEKVLPSSHTTPDPLQLHRAFRAMVDDGCRFCFMEVSSHALDQDRVAGIPFRVAVFTNLTHDHLDYHGGFREYIQAKKRLFDGLDPGSVALINADDRQAGVMTQNCRATVKTYSLKRMADYRAKLIENAIDGLHLEVDGKDAWFRLMGSFNAYNLLAVYATAVELGQEPEAVLVRLSELKGVNGRFQTIRSEQNRITAIVDYAHTPDALENVLNTLRDIRKAGTLILTVVGAGGNRDKTKRPDMGKIAARLSDQVILTSDNPRDEVPAEIIREMLEGVPQALRKKVLTVENRKEAIQVACRMAGENDFVLVAGKGHETYQEIKGVKYPFDDSRIIREIFELIES
jgi:UDP-N-acetylmuramoyl-L-alanyl-D-glutamate--2,6-diaminopimelate ligase